MMVPGHKEKPIPHKGVLLEIGPAFPESRGPVEHLDTTLGWRGLGGSSHDGPGGGLAAPQSTGHLPPDPEALQRQLPLKKQKTHVSTKPCLGCHVPSPPHMTHFIHFGLGWWYSGVLTALSLRSLLVMVLWGMVVGRMTTELSTWPCSAH